MAGVSFSCLHAGVACSFDVRGGIGDFFVRSSDLVLFFSLVRGQLPAFLHVPLTGRFVTYRYGGRVKGTIRRLRSP